MFFTPGNSYAVASLGSATSRFQVLLEVAANGIPEESLAAMIQVVVDYVDQRERSCLSAWLLTGGPLRFFVPPPQWGEGFPPRPDLVEGIAFEELPVLHHVADGVRIPDILLRIFGQYDQVR